MNAIEVAVGGHLLRVQTINSLVDLDFDSLRDNDKYLVLVMRADLLWDAPGLTTRFEDVLGRRGVLAGARTDHPPGLAADLGLPMGVASLWLAQHDVTVACLDVPADVVAAVVGATGGTVGEALDAVRAQLPNALPSPSDEVLVSVAVEHALEWRALSRRRAEARARGESPWSVT